MNAERGFKLHPGAASDITSIWEFIAKDNLLAAKRVREDILDAIRRLVPFLHQGHQRRELPHDQCGGSFRRRTPESCRKSCRRPERPRQRRPPLPRTIEHWESAINSSRNFL